jgi:hypothetical protein
MNCLRKRPISLEYLKRAQDETVVTTTTTTTTTERVERVSAELIIMRWQACVAKLIIQVLQTQVEELTTHAEQQQKSRMKARDKHREEVKQLKARLEIAHSQFVPNQEDDPSKAQCVICRKKHISKRNQTRAMKRCYFRHNPGKTADDLKLEYPGKNWECST